jgi:NAD(P)-dependent dehydrogenase (short-subunit alcohol dehydrogenase family)
MTRTAVVTGAASGIGAAVARQLIDDGWQVIGLDRAFGDAVAVAPSEQVEGLVPVACDVSDEASIEAAFARVAERFGHLDALVCAAGILATGALVDMPVADFDRIFAVNTRGAWLCARAGVALMRRRPDKARPARLVFIGSISGIRPKTGGGAYGAQKSALHVITGVMAAELAPEGILVNAVAPGTVETPMIAAVTAAPATGSYRPSGVSPLGRVAQPEDVANVVRFLCGGDAAYVAGSIIPVDGATRAAFVPPAG